MINNVATLIRCALSAGVAAVTFVLFYYQFLPYSERNRAQTGFNALIIMILAFLTGLMFGVGTTRRYVVAAGFMLGMFAANAILFEFDTAVDPTTHNLIPFEFVILGVLAAPAFVGAAASQVIDSVRRGKK